MTRLRARGPRTRETTEFRQHPATAAVSIVALSGHDDHRTRAVVLAAGADDYLVKLPDRDTLIACLRRQTVRGQAAVRGEAAAAAAP